MNTSTELLAREELTPTVRSQMFELLRAHFDGVLPAQFRADLEEKNWVLLVRRNEDLVGFTTMAVYERTFDNESITVIYSGDTIVRPDAWNSTALARGWISAVNSLAGKMGNQKCYWLLLTSGFRTYRFLPVFWKDFYPKYDASANRMPLLQYLAAERFGANYNPEKGIVRFRHPQRLAGNLKQIPSGRAFDPHIAFFLSRNPGWVEGDELVCLTELSDENLTAAGRRMTRTQSDEVSLCCR